MSARREDLFVRRKEKARMVKRPSNLDLTRREPGEGPSEVLQAAVVAALMLGQPAAIIAQRFNLPPATVRRWEEAYDISNPIKRRDNLSEMLMVFIEQELASLMSISMITSEENWVRAQDAGELASFIAVKQDRIMAVLAAYSKAQASRQVLTGEVVNDSD